MTEWWNGLGLMEQIFYLIAIPSTIILVLQTLLLLFGIGSGGDADADADMDTDLDGDGNADIDGADHEVGLRLFTVRGIIAFCSLFGWTGVVVLDMGGSVPVAFTLSFVAGILALLVVALVMRASMKLQQSGNLDLQNAIGQTGEVYLTIPKGGRGKVSLILQERYIDLDAICPSGTVKNGEQVMVTGITNNNTLIVAPLNKTNK
ncbi:MAG TPA: hypothetical protein GXX54_06505 [Clostridiales bacterium]|nr:hypothetical protein [Clostridiales bacterium]